MANMSIGQVAKRCGLAPSAIRYYEKAWLLPKPIRVSRQRRYGAEAIGRLRLLQAAREAGFTIAETRTFVAGFSRQAMVAPSWGASPDAAAAAGNRDAGQVRPCVRGDVVLPNRTRTPSFQRIENGAVALRSVIDTN